MPCHTLSSFLIYATITANHERSGNPCINQPLTCPSPSPPSPAQCLLSFSSCSFLSFFLSLLLIINIDPDLDRSDTINKVVWVLKANYLLTPMLISGSRVRKTLSCPPKPRYAAGATCLSCRRLRRGQCSVTVDAQTLVPMATADCASNVRSTKTSNRENSGVLRYRL